METSYKGKKDRYYCFRYAVVGYTERKGLNGNDIVLQVLSFVAENERSNIRQRQAEGIAAAKARGVKFGRPPKPLPENFHTVYQRWKNGKITGTKAAEECNMPITTFRYKADIYEKTNFL